MLTTRAHGISSAETFELWAFVPGQIEYAWPELESFVMKALEFSHGEITVENIHGFLLRGEMQVLALAEKGKMKLVLIVEFFSWPQYKAMRVVAMAGSNLLDLRRFRLLIEEWVLSQGAVEIEAWSRPEVTRVLQLLGFTKSHDVVRYDLRGKLQ